jgi:integrase
VLGVSDACLDAGLHRPPLGEATGLRVRSLNKLRSRFVIEENAVMIAYEIHVGTPKTHEKRSVPYPERLAPMIEQACAGKGPEGLLCGDGVNHMRNSGSKGWFANAIRRAQEFDLSIPRLTPHDLRHTAGSLAISSGANVKAVQRMLGHASAAMTLDTYADLFDDDLDAVASRLNDAMPLIALRRVRRPATAARSDRREQIAQFSDEARDAKSA